MSKRKVIPFPKAEPAMVRAVVMVLGVLATLGVSAAANVDGDTITALAIGLGLLMPVVQGLWTRYVVTPKAQVLAQVTTDGHVVAGDAAVEPTGMDVSQPAPGGPSPVVASVAVKPELVKPAA